MVDYSFIRFKEDFTQAKNLGSPLNVEFIHTSCIHLQPNETYAQISNYENGIVLSGDYTAELVNECGNLILNIDDDFKIYEFVDNNGKPQIFWQINIPQDLGFEPLHIKLTHTESENIYYSNAFVCTETLIENTSLFLYRDYHNLMGIDYVNSPEFYQKIRLNIYFNNIENATEVEDYYQITTHNTVSSRPRFKMLHKFLSEYMNFFTFVRFSVLMVHNVIYVNKKRITNKPIPSSEDRIGATDMFVVNMECYISETDTYNNENDLKWQFEEFNIIEVAPKGVYVVRSEPNVIQLTFNRFISKLSGFIQIRRYSDDVVVNTVNIATQGAVTDDYYIAPKSILGLGKYYITISENSFKPIDEDNLYVGNTDKDKYTFEVVPYIPDYSANDYSANDYKTS